MSDQSVQKHAKPTTAVADSEKTSSVTVQPPVDILETDDEYLLLADLPGVQPQDVDVRFENGELLLHGKRSASHKDKRPAFWEHGATHYHRVFRLNENVAADRIHAELNAGVLTVHLPKVEAAKPRRINVKG